MPENEALRQIAIDSYNQAFQLVVEGDDAAGPRGLELARQSLEAWRQVGTAKNEAIGLWMLSRALHKVGDDSAALEAGEQSLAIAEELGLDWMIASALEALTRASAGLPSHADYHDRAVAAIDAIAEPDDRALIAQQFADLRKR